MQAITTYKTDGEIDEIHVESLQMFKDNSYDENKKFERKGDVLKGWKPGSDIYARFVISDLFEGHVRPVINWYCPNTHFRGALLEAQQDTENGKTVIIGKVDGHLIREKFVFKILLLNSEGYVISIQEKRNVILEGKQSYFPILASKYDKDAENGFCHVKMLKDTDPEELFSIVNCAAVFNRDSALYNEEEGSPKSYMPIRYFALYEIWRQVIEVALSNDYFTEFMVPETTEDDLKVGEVLTTILNRIFPGKSLEEIRNMRDENYWKFCSIIQSETLKGCQGL